MRKGMCFSLMLAGVAVAAPALARSSDASTLAGRWSLDTSRLQMPPDARPRRVLMTFTPAAKDALTMDVDIIYANGKEVHSVGTDRLDGTPAPVKGSPEADTAAMKQPQPDVLVLALSRAGVPASTRVYAVARDGQSMVETAVYYGRNGRPILATHYFKRAR